MSHRPRKRFGQHFLSDGAVLQRIAEAVAVRADDAVLEIGPGQGALTDVMLDAPMARYVAVEIDRDLAPLLRARYGGQASVPFELVNEDILRTDMPALLEGRDGWRVVGNLPYNISSPLILKLAELVAVAPGLVRDAHFMLQREMAERLCAVPGSKAWGRLSVIVQLRFAVEPLFDVPPEAFTPPPRVFSAVVRMTPLEAAVPCDVAILDDVLRRAFSGRRKRLSNALKQLELDWDRLDVEPSVRADDVTSAQFVEIAQSLEEQARGAGASTGPVVDSS